MIYTVTLNPSLDYVVWMEELKQGRVNRSRREELFFGGKGLNVTSVLRNLGVDSVALGFTAGFTGERIETLLREAGCRSDFIRVREGISRINIKLKAGCETEINGTGPKPDGEELRLLLERLDALGAGDLVVLAGSVPPALPQDIYEQILRRLDGRGVDAVVDATGDSLLRTLPFRPLLIKPNHHELGELFGAEAGGEAELAGYARRLQHKGARNVLVSMAGAGALLLCEDGRVLRRSAPRGNVVNSTGAGDSMVAGFLAGYRSGHDCGNALRLGLAAGSATAFSERLADKSEIDAVYAALEED